MHRYRLMYPDIKQFKLTLPQPSTPLKSHLHINAAVIIIILKYNVDNNIGIMGTFTDDISICSGLLILIEFLSTVVLQRFLSLSIRILPPLHIWFVKTLSDSIYTVS